MGVPCITSLCMYHKQLLLIVLNEGLICLMKRFKVIYRTSILALTYSAEQQIRDHSQSLGKYHGLAGLQFYKLGLNYFTTYLLINTFFSFLVKSNLFKLEASHTVIFPLTVSALSE